MPAILPLLLALALLAAAPSAAGAAGLAVEIAPSPGDPAEPRMGDQLTYHATIRNDGSDTASGIVVWLSLLRADPGLEAPVDLEDWSAQKAVKLAALAPGEAARTDWPIRLIQPGTYRVAVIAASGNAAAPVASRLAGFVIAPKPVIDSGRVLTVALGAPLLLGGVLVWRLRRGRRGAA